MQDVKLFTFITLAETKNYTRAAEILNLTQPAVTQHVKHIEELYGKSLIRRQGKNFELTDQGKIIYEFGIKILNLYKEMKTQINNDRVIEKVYNFGTTITSGTSELSKILGMFKQKHNNIDIRMQVQTVKENIDKLDAGDVDMVLIDDSFDKMKYNYKKFKDDELVLVAHPNSPLILEGAVRLNKILDGKLILNEKGYGTRDLLEKKIEEIGQYDKTLKGYMEINDINTIVSLIESNLGYAFLPRSIIKNKSNRGNVAIVPVQNFEVLMEQYFIYRKNSKEHEIKAFIEYCRKFHG